MAAGKHERVNEADLPEVTKAEETSPFDVISPEGDTPSSEAAGDGNGGADSASKEAFERLKQLRAERRRKKLIRRGIVAGVIALVVVAAVVWRTLASQQPAEPEQPVMTEPVVRGTFTSDVTGSGSIQPVSQTVVAPQIDGTIETVNVVAGQAVAQGDVLFTVKNPDLDRAVSEAGRTVRQAKAALEKARQALKAAKQAKADGAKAASATQTSSTDAADAGAEAPVAAPAFDEASAKQAIDEAASQVEDAKLQLEAANDAYAKAEEQAAQRTVRAPSAGSVIELNAVPGQPLGAAGAAAAQDGTSGGTGALCRIADLSQMKVTVQVGEVDVNKVKVDQAATATFSAVPDAMLSATVRGIASTSTGGADAAMYGGYGGQGVTYAVELLVPEPDPRLKPGMTANVSIVCEQVDDTLIVPASALTDLGGDDALLYVETNSETHEARQVSVKVRARNTAQAAVASPDGSLNEGDAVVTSGVPANVTNAGDVAGAVIDEGGTALPDTGEAAGEGSAGEAAGGEAASGDAGTSGDAPADAPAEA